MPRINSGPILKCTFCYVQGAFLRFSKNFKSNDFLPNALFGYLLVNFKRKWPKNPYIFHCFAKIVVEINIKGWNNIGTEKKLTIHPISYDMYERFLPCAYPYYASAFSMMFGVFLLAFNILYHADQSKKEVKKSAPKVAEKDTKKKK